MPAPPVFQPPPGNPRFPLFDSLRGIAAFGVFLVHASLIANADGTWYGHYVVSLESVLAIFFVISAFLLYRPFVAARVDRTPTAPRIGDYAWNRFLRIVPAYWVALTVLAVYPGLGGFWGENSWTYYLFLQEFDYGTSRGGIIPTWSLTVEVCFYAFLPLYALLLRAIHTQGTRARRIAIELGGVALLVTIAVAYRIVLRAHIGDEPTSNLWALLPASFDWLALGMLLAVVSVALAGRRPLPVRVIERMPGLCWLVTVALLTGVSFLRPSGEFPVPTGQGEWLAIHVAYGLAALFVCLPAAIGWEHGGLVRGLLRTRLLGWFGMISYGFFLWHHPILVAVGDLELGGLWDDHRYLGVMLVAFPISVACGAASYYLVERPILRRKRSRTTQRDRPRSEPAARAA
jgi:peptidoglycan/LPS O-acetylase OafA/YrhL